jgi:hypothetical protein
MKLFELNRSTYEIEVAAEALLLSPFKKIVDRDKSKTKDTAKKELALVYHYCDVRSDYMGIDDEAKLALIIDNLKLPDNYKIDSVMEEAIEFYKKRSYTIIEKLYEGAVISATDVDTYLRNTKALLSERDDNGKIVTDISKITASLEKLPKIMANIKAAEEVLIKERKETAGKGKGNKSLNMFEDGV